MEKSVRFAFVAIVIFAVFYAYFYIGYRPVIKQLKDAEEAINSLPSTDLTFIINGEIGLIKDEQLGKDNVTYHDLPINNIDELISALGKNYRKAGNIFRYYDKEGGSYLCYEPKTNYQRLYHRRISYPMKLILNSEDFLTVVFHTWLFPTISFHINDIGFDDFSRNRNAEFYLERDKYYLNKVTLTHPFILSAGLTIYLLPLIALFSWGNLRNKVIALFFYWPPAIFMIIFALTLSHAGPSIQLISCFIAPVFVTLKTMEKKYTG